MCRVLLCLIGDGDGIDCDDGIAMSPLIRKKFRWGTIFPIGLKRYRDLKEEPTEKESFMELKGIWELKQLTVKKPSSVKDKILAAPCEESKVEIVTAEMMRGLDQLMEMKEDEVREDYKMEKLARLYIDEIVAGHGVPVLIISNRDRGFTSRILANIRESHRDVIGYKYGLSSSKDKTNYHSSIQFSPFGALYGRICRSPVLWAEIGESRLIRLELVQETTDKVVLIKEKLKAARDRQKSYADNRRKLLEFEVADQVLLKVSPWKCVVDKTLRFVEEPVEIIDREVKSLKRSRIPIVKVHWNLKRGHEDFLKSKYLLLLVEQAIVRSTNAWTLLGYCMLRAKCLCVLGSEERFEDEVEDEDMDEIKGFIWVNNHIANKGEKIGQGNSSTEYVISDQMGLPEKGGCRSDVGSVVAECAEQIVTNQAKLEEIDAVAVSIGAVVDVGVRLEGSTDRMINPPLLLD
ncbi:hypothetical protein Tco_1094860 [Tanacetum coccineum]|uniref:Reverse transcriptase domain-containing protein n=1 Tax=Tanacetum coccineum TaxID=301880 RepID=A0ABQ5IIQ1_9ASTR